MTDLANLICAKPTQRPACPNFSSGPCAKHPGWDLRRLSTQLMGRSHRSASGKQRLAEAIDRSRQLLGVPEDWVVGIVPGSATGAITFALLNLLGPRDVDLLQSDGFSAYWAHDVAQMMSCKLHVHQAEGFCFPDTSALRSDHDLVFVYNGTGNGVRVPSLDWISDQREGLVIADAASAAFAMPLDFAKLDALTWSWQKGLGGEAGHGMVAFSPRALGRALSRAAHAKRPKLMSFCKADGTALLNLFEGYTISTPSLLALEDLHSALDWAESIGGREALFQRVRKNHRVIADWVDDTPWIDWLAQESCRSQASLCLKISVPQRAEQAQTTAQAMRDLLAHEGVAYDIFTMHDAPAGLRIWAGPTIEAYDLDHLTRWLDWAYFMSVRRTRKLSHLRRSAPPRSDERVRAAVPVAKARRTKQAKEAVSVGRS